MSDVMLLGVLRMPIELWDDDSVLDKLQRYSRYIEAADRIEMDKLKIMQQQVLIDKLMELKKSEHE